MSLTPLSAPLIIAEARGLFAEHGIEVRISDVVGGHRAAKKMLSGEGKIATTSDAVVMFKSLERDDFVVIATFVSNDNDVKLVTTDKSGIADVRGLVGKRIGTVMGSASHFFVDRTLVLHGVDPTAVTIVPLNPEDAPKALREGMMDAVSVWEPFAYLAMRELGGRGRIIEHDRAYILTFSLIVQKDFARTHREDLKKFLMALQEAIGFIRENSTDASTIVARRLSKSPEIIAASWPDLEFGLSLHQWFVEALELEAQWAIDKGLTKSDRVPNYLDFIDATILRNVDRTAVTVY